jgi:hypothetical protein
VTGALEDQYAIITYRFLNMGRVRVRCGDGDHDHRGIAHSGIDTSYNRKSMLLNNGSSEH